MKVTIKKLNGRESSSTNLDSEDDQIIVTCFNALTGVGYAPDYILKKMYEFSSQFIKTEETQVKPIKK